MAKSGRGGRGKGAITLVRKEEVVEGGHHGGAWKVAYADFVTAMMAFFLLMWLLNATTEDQRRGIADCFSPIAALGKSVSGTGLPFGGKTPFSVGSLTSDRGAAQVVQGRAEFIPDVEEDDSDTPAKPRQYARTGPATEQTGAAALQM
jgi:chemotaxis protein MotB